MTTKRKSAEARRKELKLAISRILRGRAHTKGIKVSVSSVAKEAGVTPALIHNHYPEIAESIREIQARSSREQRDAKHSELQLALKKNRALREEINELHSQVAKLASINEVLQAENRVLSAMRNDENVVVLKRSDGK